MEVWVTDHAKYRWSSLSPEAFAEGKLRCKWSVEDISQEKARSRGGQATKLLRDLSRIPDAAPTHQEPCSVIALGCRLEAKKRVCLSSLSVTVRDPHWVVGIIPPYFWLSIRASARWPVLCVAGTSSRLQSALGWETVAQRLCTRWRGFGMHHQCGLPPICLSTEGLVPP